jgi:hypothetical protein
MDGELSLFEVVVSPYIRILDILSLSRIFMKLAFSPTFQ